MNIHCPHCQTVFRIDPERVPVAGVRARCSHCAGVFALTRQGVQGRAAPEPGPVASEGARAEPAGSAPEPAGPAPEPARAEAPAAPPASPPQPSAASAPAARQRVPSFTKQDPKARAARLARALVSDIVAYNPERLEKSVAAGTLRAEFREEIVKSWEEYVAQVGLEMAKGTPFFRNALNEILARGQKVF